MNGTRFTSHDRDNDTWSSNNCASAYGTGGWWYNDCGVIYLNEGRGQVRMFINGAYHYPTFLEMKIRPLDCDIN